MPQDCPGVASRYREVKRPAGRKSELLVASGSDLLSGAGASLSNCSGRIPLISRGISRASWQSASNGWCQWFMCLRIDGAQELLRRSNSRRRKLRCRRDVACRQDPAWVIARPWMRLRCRRHSLMRRFTRHAHPTVIPSGDADRRASAPGPHRFDAVRANGAARTGHNRPRRRKIMSAG